MREPSTAPATPDILLLWRGMIWRPWFVLFLTLTGTAIATTIAWMLPPVYQSTARILVESQQIPDALARSTVTASAAERLAVIEQRLMTRENLLDVSRRLGFFEDRKDLSPTDRVEGLRKATLIESISFNANPRYRGPAQVSAFTISFETDDPRQAARAANEFAAMVLEQNLAARSARASETHDFFQAEVERLANRIATLETTVADFKSQNKVHLPGTLKVRLSELARLRQQIVARQARIERLTPQPDTNSATVTPVTLPVTESRQQGQIELLLRQQRATRERIEIVQAAIDQTTKVEMTLNGMLREFDQLKLEHKEALRKANAAATGEKLEDSQQAERFEIIERAEVPEVPIAPHREIIAVGGALASFSLAVALAGLFEWLSRMVRTRSDCQRLLGMRPVLVLPPILTRREIVRGRMISTAAVCVPVIVASVAGWMLLQDAALPVIDGFEWRNAIDVLGSIPETAGLVRGG